MAADVPDPVLKNGVLRWIDDRLPLITWGYKEFVAYPAPKNLNYFWNFGSLAGIMLMLQLAPASCSLCTTLPTPRWPSNPSSTSCAM